MASVLKEEVTFDRSAVTSLDWASYPILTFPEIPEIAYDLIDRPAEPPLGCRRAICCRRSQRDFEPVFDAAGVRLRSVHFRPP
jgi:nicotinate dehydrogenase subunit B